MSSAAADLDALMVAVVPVRSGVLPLGAAETVAECAGVVLLAGSDPDPDSLTGVATDVRVIELGPFQPARWADAIAPLVDDAALVVLPGSPDGRDLAPRLAHRLGRRLLAGAVSVDRAAAHLARDGGRSIHRFEIDGPVVATLQPGVRGYQTADRPMRLAATVDPVPRHRVIAEPEVERLLPPDVATMDLTDADRIVGGGAGLDGADRFERLARLAADLGAAMGATRVITDRGWVDHRRQIGTTGVVVDPALYVAFGVSGAVQHTAGLGDPRHIISVNTDPHCPMMQMADLAVVADANEVIDELQRLLDHGRATDG